MAGIAVLQRSLRRIAPILNRRLVSTSPKKNETVTAEMTKPETKTAVHKNWVSYGYDHKSKAEDRNALHSVMFGTITLCITVGGIWLMYLPDFNLRDWALREGYLQLKYREENGLPLIDPNFIDPAKINLPSDEELGDTEIII